VIYNNTFGHVQFTRRVVALALGPAGWRPFVMWGAGDRWRFGALRVGIGLGGGSMAVIVIGEHEDKPGPWTLALGPVQVYLRWKP
jgi:hypothetical protein